MFRAGLYARVPTHDQQTLPIQNRALWEYAARRGGTVAMQMREIGSGAEKRQAREQLIEAARRREIDLVLVWRLDRSGRSVSDLLATLQELDHVLDQAQHAPLREPDYQKMKTRCLHDNGLCLESSHQSDPS